MSRPNLARIFEGDLPLACSDILLCFVDLFDRIVGCSHTHSFVVIGVPRRNANHVVGMMIVPSVMSRAMRYQNRCCGLFESNTEH